MKLPYTPLLLVLLGAASATGQTFSEFPIPTPGARPHGITAGPDGNLWFTEYSISANKIGRITPEGVITEFPIRGEFAHPLSITAGPDGNIWFTENRGPNAIGRITSEGVITEFPVHYEANPWGIATGPNGDLWFTEEWYNRIGHITMSGSITESPSPRANGVIRLGLNRDRGGSCSAPTAPSGSPSNTPTGSDESRLRVPSPSS